MNGKTKQRKIWIFNHYAIPPSLPGGTRHYDFARNLVLRGHRVAIVASSFHHSSLQETQKYTTQPFLIEEVDGIKYVWLKTPPYCTNNWRRIRNMLVYACRVLCQPRCWSEIRKNLGTPDVVIGSSPHLFAAFAALKVALRFHAKFIFEVRDLWPQSIVDMGLLEKESLLAKILYGLERKLCNQANRIILIPPRATQYYEKLNVASQKKVWIPNGVDVGRFCEPEEQSQSGAFQIIYTGAHGPSNGLENVIEAARILQERKQGHIQIVFVGDGSKKNDLKLMASNFGLKNLVFKDPIPKTEIPKLLLVADALLHIELGLPDAQKYGGSPNKIYDYMAAGKPLIVASAFIGKEIGAVGCCINVDPEKPKELADAFEKISHLSQSELYKMGMLGRCYVAKNYNMSLLTDKLEGVIESVCYEETRTHQESL